MPNHSNGKIYSIRFFDNDKLMHISSTTQILAIRFGGHKETLNALYINTFKIIILEILNVAIWNY